ncbi:helix-turn-helix domain-containing protein [Peribacillus sp. SCS-155]|uniref:helix-turn-helix domain-containing protein n=1 Tax=Peribacillus sedimenti TaxID=3115297 RepID=UPI0039063ACF
MEAPNHDAIVERIRKKIEEEYGAALTLDILAKEVGMSKYHLHRLFKKNTGSTPQEYITNIRMLHAGNLIRNSNTNITDIAFLSGYRSSAHFSEIFYQYFGCTPTDYRKRTRGDYS